MRLLITGATGLLGLNLALDASGTHEVTGVARQTLSAAPFRMVSADLLEREAVQRLVEDSKPDAVIHCAAAADIDWCERNPELARQINAEIPERMARACRRHNVRLIHISTDAVFDGRKPGSYSEADRPNPIDVYGSTKYAAEDAVLGAEPRAIVARVNFYGWSLSGNRSLAEFFVNNLSQGIPINGFTDVVFCPMLVNHLGEMLLQMLDSELHGLYHVVGAKAMTKLEFGVALARTFGFKEELISPQSVDHFGLAARRAHNLHLSTHKLSTALSQSLPRFSTGIRRFYTQYCGGYPQRIRSYQQDPGGQDLKSLGAGARAAGGAS